MLSEIVAKDLLPFVNSNHYESLLDYVKSRINILQTDMNSRNDLNEILKLQGRIQELQRFLTLREESNVDSKNKK